MKVILFTGLSASGKSAISKRVSQNLGIPRVDLHSIIHEVAEKEGFSRARDWIESIGVPSALEQSAKALADSIEKHRNSKGVIVDEVIEHKTLSFLEKNLPKEQFFIIYIKANRHDRERFMKNRLNTIEGKIAKKELRFIDRLKDAVGIRIIIQNADLRFENFMNVENVAFEISKTLEDKLFKENWHINSKERRD